MDNVTAARKEAVPAAASAAPDTGSAQSTVQAKPEIDGFNLLIEALKLNGIDTIFGLPGIPITDLTRKAQAAGIRVISFRHALVLGYWHTIVTPPMVFANLVVEIVEEMKAKGIHKPVVASLAGDVQVEEAAEYLFQHGIPAYPYSTEMPVAVLGAKYKWARGAGLL